MMETIIDQPRRLRALDTGGMLEVLSRFPESCRDAIEAAEGLNLDSLSRKDFKTVAFLGVGGSAIGGHIIHDWLQDSCHIPFYVSRGYHLPRFIDEDTLIFAVSYSGNTEETLNAFREALERRCPIVAVTSGGKIQRLSAEKGIPLLGLPRGMQPRAALPSQFFSLATVIRRLGFASELWGEVEEAIEVLGDFRSDLVHASPTVSNPAKQLALGLRGLVPFVYGPRLFGAVAYRIRTQLNENSKVPAGSGFFPEAFHNAVMGCEGPEEIRRRICALIICDPKGPPEMERKTEGFKRLLESSGVRVLEIHARGRGKLARMFSALYVGDYAATYLGLLYGLDPSSTESISALKRF